MSLEQGKLFPQAERLKLRQARVKRLTRSYFDRLWKKGYDPAYILEIEPDDLPTLAEVYVRSEICVVPAQGTVTLGRKKAIVLSKGLEDPDRRIVARDGGGWIFGLWIALLQRQVREGTEKAKGWCYGVITELECDEFAEFQIDRWTKDLLSKRQI